MTSLRTMNNRKRAKLRQARSSVMVSTYYLPLSIPPWYMQQHLKPESPVYFLDHWPYVEPAKAGPVPHRVLERSGPDVTNERWNPDGTITVTTWSPEGVASTSTVRPQL